jgi:hypothetical protein
MTSALVPMSHRMTLQTLVYQRVHHVFRTYPQFTQFRRRFPVALPILVVAWRNYVTSVGTATTAGATEWVPAWIKSWFTPPTTGTPISGGGAQGDQPPADPYRLTVRQLVDMLDDSSAYVAHRTDNYAAGTCRDSLRAENDPHKRKNPSAPPGIYGTIGVTGLPDYGPYGVVIKKSAVLWLNHEGAVVRFSGEEIPVSLVEGWYAAEDLEKAKALRKRRT